MKVKGIRVNLITYNAVVAALATAAKQANKPLTAQKEQQLINTSKEGLWTRALDLLDQIQAENLKPDGFTFSSAIACCGAEGKWQEALKLIEAMQKGGPATRPNKIAYTAAIGRSPFSAYGEMIFKPQQISLTQLVF